MNKAYKLRPSLEEEFKHKLIDMAWALRDAKIISKKQQERCVQKINERYGRE
jgi:hypothetical protein